MSFNNSAPNIQNAFMGIAQPNSMQNMNMNMNQQGTNGTMQTQPTASFPQQMKMKMMSAPSMANQAQMKMMAAPAMANQAQMKMSSAPPLANQAQMKMASSPALANQANTTSPNVKPPSKVTKVCSACRYDLPQEDYFPNHWYKKDEFSRCKTCCMAGIFSVNEEDPQYYFVGWPKCPLQVLLERGLNIEAFEKNYSPAQIGEIILRMPDRLHLLKAFEIAGHYGYGGINEGLCCMPGCTKSENLLLCGCCEKAKYCCLEHQQLHWPLHSGRTEEDNNYYYQKHQEALKRGYFMPYQHLPMGNADKTSKDHSNEAEHQRDRTDVNGGSESLTNPNKKPRIKNRLDTIAEIALAAENNQDGIRGLSANFSSSSSSKVFGKLPNRMEFVKEKNLNGNGGYSDSEDVYNESSILFKSSGKAISNTSATAEDGDTNTESQMGKRKNSETDSPIYTFAGEEITDRSDVRPVVRKSDAALATKFSFAVLAQFCPCGFRESDRQGKRRGLTQGYPGLQCRHCFGADRKGGRFFPSSIKTMADTKKTLMSIKNHLMKCDRCPYEIKDKIMELEPFHEQERRDQKYGSQKAFFTIIWNRIHEDKI